MTDAFVLGGVRTPFARYGSSLSHIRADDLLGMTMKGACQSIGVGLDQIEDIVAGCVNPAHEGMGDVAPWLGVHEGPMRLPPAAAQCAARHDFGGRGRPAQSDTARS